MIKSKHSQITPFIIIAVLLAAAILLVFLALRQRSISIQQQLNPESNIEGCTKDAAEEAVNIMLPQGGYINPENYILHQNNKVAYLCFNKGYYYPCVNQEPVYLAHLEEEITSYVKPKIEECFSSLKQELEKKGYSVDAGVLKIETLVLPNRIEVEIDKRFETTKNQETKKYDKFKIRKISPLFELANVAREIANQEAKYCNFEYLGYMLFYPKFDISKQAVGQGLTASKIYTIGDRSTGKKLNIAIRSCAIPAGLF